MLKAIINWFTGKPAPEAEAPRVAPEAAPYKTEPAPPPILVPEAVPVIINEPPRCGCGRSSTGYCVGLHKLSEADWASHVDNPNRVVAAPAKPARKPRAQPAKKAEKKPPTPAIKAPRKPRPKKS